MLNEVLFSVQEMHPLISGNVSREAIGSRCWRMLNSVYLFWRQVLKERWQGIIHQLLLLSLVYVWGKSVDSVS